MCIECLQRIMFVFLSFPHRSHTLSSFLALSDAESPLPEVPVLGGTPHCRPCLLPTTPHLHLSLSHYLLDRFYTIHISAIVVEYVLHKHVLQAGPVPCSTARPIPQLKPLVAEKSVHHLILQAGAAQDNPYLSVSQ